MRQDLDSMIDETAIIGQNTILGQYCVIQADVKIGDDCQIGSHVVIHAGSRIGRGTQIADHAIIGKKPMRARRSIFKEKEDLAPAAIGENCLIGAGAVIYVATQIGSNVLIADTASVREDVSIGEYTIVGRSVTVENLTTIGKKCKLETGCYITAYSVLEDFCFIAPNVTTSNDNYLGRTEERFKHFKGITVRRGGRIGAGAVILPGIEIGSDAVVGAGSVVTRNVPARTTVLGAPAKTFRDTPVEQLLENQGWDL